MKLLPLTVKPLLWPRPLAETWSVAGMVALEDWKRTLRQRGRDYVELTKPRIVSMVLVTTAVGGLLACAANPWTTHLLILLMWGMLGTACLAAGACIFNHLLERDVDARMGRTAGRPLPCGRIQEWEAGILGLTLAGLGFGSLLHFVNSTTALLGLASFSIYVAIYTPMKRWTAWNTAVGAIPGALPILMGWTSVSPTLTWVPALLFGLLFFWQFPHFYAIAWLCRNDYARAGIRMLPTTPAGCRQTPGQACLLCLVMVWLSLALLFTISAGLWCQIAVSILGGWFFFRSWQFWRTPDDNQARRLMLSSILYLPGVLFCLSIAAYF